MITFNETDLDHIQKALQLYIKMWNEIHLNTMFTDQQLTDEDKEHLKELRLNIKKEIKNKKLHE